MAHLDTLSLDSQLDTFDNQLHSDIRKELQALEIEEQRLKLEISISLSEKKKKVGALRAKATRSEDCWACPPAKHPNQPQGHKPVTVDQVQCPEYTEDVTLQSLAKNKDLESALEILKNCHLECLHPTSQGPAPVQGKSNMLHLIPDFVSKPTASYQSGSEKEKVKKVEEITQAQWISGNSKILLKLIEEGMNIDGVKAYLRYVSKVGDYLQVSEASSVMLLDNEHRKQVHEESRQWDHIDRDKGSWEAKAAPGPWPEIASN